MSKISIYSFMSYASNAVNLKSLGRFQTFIQWLSIVEPNYWNDNRIANVVQSVQRELTDDSNYSIAMSPVGFSDFSFYLQQQYYIYQFEDLLSPTAFADIVSGICAMLVEHSVSSLSSLVLYPVSYKYNGDFYRYSPINSSEFGRFFDLADPSIQYVILIILGMSKYFFFCGNKFILDVRFINGEIITNTKVETFVIAIKDLTSDSVAAHLSVLSEAHDKYLETLEEGE